jgi:RNA polymerase sigma-70 factor (ECF subfamily)
MDFLSLFRHDDELRSNLEQCRARLYRMAYAWCHNAALAEDLVQDALAKAMRKCGQLRDAKARDAWLFAILTNCYRDHFRRQRDMDDVDEVEIVLEATPESENSRRETVDLVRRTIARLPEGQRQVVTLVDLEGFSYAEVAAILDVPIGTVMSRLCRARNAMREWLLPAITEQDNSKATESKLRRIK